MSFNFRFGKQQFFTQDLNEEFNSREDLIEYYKQFREEYDSFYKRHSKDFKARMKGKYVKGYQELHDYSVKLEDHYKLLLTVGTNGFDVWLNDIEL